MGNNITHFFKNTSQIFLYGSFFMLPLSLYFNNLLLLLFIVFFGLNKILIRPFLTFSLSKSDFITFFIFTIPFILPFIGLFYPKGLPEAIKSFERVIPVLFIAYYVFLDRAFFKAHTNKIWIFFVAGTLVAALICWSTALKDILSSQKSILLIFSQEYSSHNLTAILDIHTPYLALFVNAAIGFLILTLNIERKGLNKSIIVVSIIILTVFLFNLMSRNALFCYLIFLTIYLIKSKRIYLLCFLYSLLIFLGVLIFNTEKNYHRDRFVNSINVFETETIFSKKDDRFSRWGASLNVFRNNPVFGPGPVKVKELRKEEYIKNLDSVAYNYNYNSHNQFIEYLSTYGLLGAILFLLLIFKLFKLAINKKSYLLVFLVTCLFLSSMTESVLFRSWGISFYILVLLSLTGFSEQKKWDSLNKTK